jgi:hypothetical protein
MARKKSANTGSVTSSSIMLLTNVIHKIGIPGGLLLVIIYLIIFSATLQQKQQLIDKWLLFKNNDNSQVFTYSVIIFAIIIYCIEMYTFHRIRKIDRTEIDFLANWKSNKQKEELGKALHKSD